MPSLTCSCGLVEHKAAGRRIQIVQKPYNTMLPAWRPTALPDRPEMRGSKRGTFLQACVPILDTMAVRRVTSAVRHLPASGMILAPAVEGVRSATGRSLRQGAPSLSGFCERVGLLIFRASKSKSPPSRTKRKGGAPGSSLDRFERHFLCRAIRFFLPVGK